MMAAVMLVLLGLGACSRLDRSGLKAERDRKKAPNFSLKDSDGRTVKLTDYEGKVVLLNFWATWCGPCKVEIPWFIQFERKYKGDGFAVVGVSMDEDGWDAVKPFVADEGINYRVLLGNDTVANLYGGVDSLPTTFLIDRQGRIAKVHIGLVSKSVYENDLNKLLESPSGAAYNRGIREPIRLASAR
jgi:peroxiredoxin